ncbi:MAG: hypothetical protein JWR69_1511 [Pedosphaera sp.]|nr:hypothetical protein [Pedosphaera sp.]
MNLESLFCRPIQWECSPTDRYMFNAVVEGEEVSLRRNDFPAEPICTLLQNGEELDFEEFGEHWILPWQKGT